MNNRDGGGFWGWLATRWASSESTQRETWSHNLETKGGIPFVQFLLLLVSLCCIIVGLWLSAWPLFGELGLAEVGLAVVGCAVVVFGTIYLGRTVRMPWWVVVLTAILLCSLLLAGARVLVAGLSGWGAVGFWFGLCLVVSSVLLAQHMMKELVNPWWRQSPFERVIGPAVAAYLVRGEDKPEVGGDWVRLNAGTLKELGVLLSRERPADAPEDSAPAAAIDFLEFLVEARQRGLSRDGAWIVPNTPRVRLPTTGLSVTRSVYERMIEQATEWQVITYTSRGWEWVAGQPAKVLKELAKEILGENGES